MEGSSFFERKVDISVQLLTREEQSVLVPGLGSSKPTRHLVSGNRKGFKVEKCVFQPYDEVFIFLSHPLPKWDCHLLKLWAPLLNDPNRLQPGSERGD